MKIKIPSDYGIPPGIEEGEEFKEIFTVSFDSSGNLNLISIGDDEIKLTQKKPKSGKESIKEKINERTV